MPLSTENTVYPEGISSTPCGRRVGPVPDRLVALAGAAVDQPVGGAVYGIDEVVAAAAEEGVGAEVPEEAVVAVVADQDVGAVGALDALVVGTDLVRRDAARGAAGAADFDPHRRVRPPVGDRVVAAAAGEEVALAGRHR